MRTQGLVAEPPPARPADHLCWVYDDAARLVEAVEAFVAGGLARDERLLCIGDSVVDGLRATDGALGDLPALVEQRALQVLSTEQAYGGAGFSPEAQLEYYRTATEQALAEGYGGLRVVAEVTPLAADPTRRAELERWEHLADQFMAEGSGFAAMCAYDSRVLDADVVAALASVHPAAHPPGDEVPFRIFFDDDRLVLAGCVDTFGAGRLGRVLATSPGNDSPLATLDLSRLEFVDAAGCRVLAGWVSERRDRGGAVDLVGTSRTFRRVWHLLGYDTVVLPGPRGPSTP